MKQTLFYITLIILTFSHASLALAWRHVSPYAYCAGDPVNKVDPDGRDLCPLLEPQGAGGLGHMAILIQMPDPETNDLLKWFLFSKNGVQSSRDNNGNGVTLPSGPNSLDKGDNVGNVTNPETGQMEVVCFDSPQEFLDSKYNKDLNGNILYTEGYIIESTRAEDLAAKNAACNELNKPYNLLGSNCAYMVQKALEAAGKSSGHFKFGTDNGLQQLLIPKGRFRMITRENNGIFCRPLIQQQPRILRL